MLDKIIAVLLGVFVIANTFRSTSVISWDVPTSVAVGQGIGIAIVGSAFLRAAWVMWTRK